MNDFNNLPRHIAFIMDGNGRWAEKRGLARKDGHVAGVKTMQEIISFCKDKIQYVSFFAFSKENWSRPPHEVDSLFAIIQNFLENQVQMIENQDMSLRFIGDLQALPKNIAKACKKINDKYKTAKTVVCIYLNYGGKDDILNTCNQLIRTGKKNIKEKDFEERLYTSGLPEPDLVIRTGGEKRLSNFMLFQLAYSELLFTDCYWPDFDNKHLEEALADYSKRVRRFGA